MVSSEIDYFAVDPLVIYVLSNEMRKYINSRFTGTYSTDASGQLIFTSSNEVMISILDTEGELTDDTEVEIFENIYKLLLFQTGETALKEYGKTTIFQSQIIPNLNFEYKTDWNLGDIVKIENGYGISVQARIVEVIEVLDENGYSIEPKYEYINNN